MSRPGMVDVYIDLIIASALMLALSAVCLSVLASHVGA